MGSKDSSPYQYLAMTDEERENVDADYAAFEEWRDAFKQAKASARKTLLAQIAKREVIETMPQYFKDKLDQQNSVDPKHFAFITVNPKDNTLDNFEALNKATYKCISKRWVTQYAYCYEQRSTDPDDIFGLHAHIILIRGTKRPSELEREVRNTFKHLCGNERHIDIQWKKKEWHQGKIDYMNGLKTGETKDIKVEVDIVMRKHLGLKQKIFSNYITDAEVSQEGS